MENYSYKPTRFYITVFILTWSMWGLGLIIKGDIALVFMLIGLLMLGTVAVTTVLTSGNICHFSGFLVLTIMDFVKWDFYI